MNLESLKKSKFATSLKILNKEKPRKYSLLGLTALTCIFFLLFAINPTLSTIANLSKQRDDLKFIDTSLQTKISSLDSLQSKYQEIEKDLGLVSDAIPEEPSSVELTGQVQAAASSSNVSLISMSASDISISSHATPNIQSYPITIIVEGTYGNISSFLDKLFTMQRIVTFESISVDKNVQTGFLVSSIKGVAYFKK